MTTEFKLKNGSLMLSTEAPGGLYNSAQLKTIAGLVDAGAAVVKATEDQRLALFVSPDQADQVRQDLEAVGLGIRNYQQGLHQPTACVGELCPEHQQDALGTALALSETLAELAVDTPLRIGVNGCPRSCVPTHTLDISIIGETNGYRVSLGGKNTQIPEMAAFMAEGIPPAELPGLVQRVVEVYKANTEAEETLQETMERAGSTPFIEALAPYSQDAAGLDDDPFAGLGGGDEPAATETSVDDLNLDDLPSEDDFATESTSGDDELSTIADADLGDDLAADVGAETLDIDGLEADSLEDVASDLGDGLDDQELDNIAGDQEFDLNPQTGSDNTGLVDDLHLDDGGLDANVDLDPSAFDAATGDMDVPINEEPAAEIAEASADADPFADTELPDAGADLTADLGDDFANATDLDSDLGAELDGTAVDELGVDDLELADDSLSTEEFSELGEVDGTDELGDAVADDTFDSLDAGDDVIQDTALDEMDLDAEDSLDDDLVASDIAEVEDVSAEMASAAASTAGIGADDIDDDLQLDPNMEAQEVDEDAADAFEAKLNESIEEQQSIGNPEVVNAADRLAAVELVASGAEVPEEAELDEALDLDEGSFENLQVDVDGIDFSADLDTAEDDFAPETDFADVDTESDLTPVEREAVAAPATSSQPGNNGIAQVRSVGDTGLQIQLNNGIELVFDTEQISGEQSLEIDGMSLHVAKDARGLRLEVNGMAVIVPKKAA